MNTFVVNAAGSVSTVGKSDPTIGILRRKETPMLCIPIQAVDRNFRAAQFELCEAYGVDLYRDSANNVYAVHETFDRIPTSKFRARQIVTVPSGWTKINAQAAKELEA
jgi:hypothetical protein